jgi:hypothetical protein
MKAHDSGRWRTTNAGLNQFVSAIFPQTARGYVELEALQSKTRRFIPLDDRDAIARERLSDSGQRRVRRQAIMQRYTPQRTMGNLHGHLVPRDDAAVDHDPL